MDEGSLLTREQQERRSWARTPHHAFGDVSPASVAMSGRPGAQKMMHHLFGVDDEDLRVEADGVVPVTKDGLVWIPARPGH